jgi:hypothetical protein
VVGGSLPEALGLVGLATCGSPVSRVRTARCGRHPPAWPAQPHQIKGTKSCVAVGGQVLAAGKLGGCPEGCLSALSVTQDAPGGQRPYTGGVGTTPLRPVAVGDPCHWGAGTLGGSVCVPHSCPFWAKGLHTASLPIRVDRTPGGQVSQRQGSFLTGVTQPEPSLPFPGHRSCWGSVLVRCCWDRAGRRGKLWRLGWSGSG